MFFCILLFGIFCKNRVCKLIVEFNWCIDMIMSRKLFYMFKVFILELKGFFIFWGLLECEVWYVK